MSGQCIWDQYQGTNRCRSKVGDQWLLCRGSVFWEPVLGDQWLLRRGSVFGDQYQGISGCYVEVVYLGIIIREQVAVVAWQCISCLSREMHQGTSIRDQELLWQGSVLDGQYSETTNCYGIGQCVRKHNYGSSSCYGAGQCIMRTVLGDQQLLWYRVVNFFNSVRGSVAVMVHGSVLSGQCQETSSCYGTGQ